MPSSSSSVSSWSDSDLKKKKKIRNESDEKVYDSDGNELYIVEDIRDKKKHFDKKKGETIWLYYIKWKGYPESQMTWEPKENIYCPNLLNDFERKCEDKQKASKEKDTQEERDRQKELTDKFKKKPKDTNRRRYFDTDCNRPSTSLMKSDDKQKKNKNDSDSDSDSETKKPVNEAENKIMSKPGPKRVKEARLRKLKEQEMKEESKSKEDSNNDKKKNKSYNSDDSDDEEKNNSSDEYNAKKKIMSKPGSKRAKEASW